MGTLTVHNEYRVKIGEVKKMAEDEKKRERTHEWESPENIKEILNAVSSEIPPMIKNILASVFSEEAGRNMGRAAAAYYKEMKQGGLPEQVAVKLTEDYMRTFSSIGDMLRSGGKGEDIGKEVERKIREKMAEKGQEREEEEKDE
jgi:DNA primase large subunit